MPLPAIIGGLLRALLGGAGRRAAAGQIAKRGVGGVAKGAVRKEAAVAASKAAAAPKQQLLREVRKGAVEKGRRAVKAGQPLKSPGRFRIGKPLEAGPVPGLNINTGAPQAPGGTARSAAGSSVPPVKPPGVTSRIMQQTREAARTGAWRPERQAATPKPPSERSPAQTTKEVAGKAASAATTAAKATSRGDLQPLAQKFGHFAKAMNPLNWTSKLGEVIGKRIERGIVALGEARAEEKPLTGMQSIISALVKHERVQSVASYPGLSESEFKSRAAAGESPKSLAAADLAEKASQQKADLEEQAADATERLKQGFNDLSGSMVKLVLAAVAFPIVMKKAGEAYAESKRDLAPFHGGIGSAFARYDLQSLMLKQKTAHATGGSTSELVTELMLLRSEMSDSLNDVASIMNGGVTSLLRMARGFNEIARTMGLISQLKIIADLIEKNTRRKPLEYPHNALWKGLQEDLDRKQRGGKMPGAPKPLEPLGGP